MAFRRSYSFHVYHATPATQRRNGSEGTASNTAHVNYNHGARYTRQNEPEQHRRPPARTDRYFASDHDCCIYYSSTYKRLCTDLEEKRRHRETCRQLRRSFMRSHTHSRRDCSCERVEAALKHMNSEVLQQERTLRNLQRRIMSGQLVSCEQVCMRDSS